MKPLKRMVVHLTLLIVLTTLSACFMMPVMMIPMWTGQESESEIVGALLDANIADMARRIEEMREVAIGDIQIHNDLMSVQQAEDLLRRSIRDRTAWQLAERPGDAGPAAPPQPATGRLNTRIDREGRILRVTNALVDPATGQTLWSGTLAGPAPKAIGRSTGMGMW